ncbi:MAG: hypothetical protein ACTHJJ_06350 [Intrasporangium sp.]|uniref:hypothetical protein n=1 Tax=Intrasporangium sp. TaxID=1925024 RepID=UPI003F7F1062
MSRSGQLVASGSVLVVVAVLSGCVRQAWVPAAPAASTTAVAGCPPVVVKPGQGVAIDYTDFVVHNGVTYLSGRPQTVTPSQLGPELFRVSCTFSELNDLTHAQLPDPTEHSAAFIPAQSPVFELKNWPATCRLAAQHHGTWHVYIATSDTAEAAMYKECGLEPEPSASSSTG